MPVHDLGYRGWEGRRTKPQTRPLVVARGGISLIWRSRWLRMMLMLSWLPVLVPAIGIFFFEYSTTEPGWRGAAYQMIEGPLQRPDLAAVALEDPALVRHEIWSTLILTYFRYPQLIAMVILVGLIAPRLICYDLRSKAYLQYFSRPLSPLEYILGKSAVIWFFLVMIATLPAMMLYVIGVMLSPEISVVAETWDLPFRILAATAVLVIPTTSLAMCYSSLTTESRYATFTWFATWALGFVAYQILTFAPVGDDPMAARNRGWEGLDIDLDRWRLLSPYHTLGHVQSWVFGLQSSSSSVWPSMALLVAITLLGSWIVRRRIIARLSV